MGDAVSEVLTTGRLHLGFLDLEGGLGRRFGSVGLSLDRPCTRLLLRRAEHDDARGPDAARALSMLHKLRAAYGIGGFHDVDIRASIPPHAGLGSGTQLALALGAAMRRLHGLARDTRADAAALGRGRRSGVGIGLFDLGGVVVDGGPGRDGALPPILARLAVPQEWRILRVSTAAAEGLSGQDEVAAFASLPAMRGEDPGALCRLVLMQLLPALIEDDVQNFGAALTRMQELLGDHFAGAQGGARFTSAAVGEAIAALGAGGAVGLGQTSWGPTGFAFVRGDALAERLLNEMKLRFAGRGLDFEVCRALNRGASVSISGADRATGAT